MKNSYLVLAILLAMTFSLHAEKKRTKIATSVLCGVVTDLAGAPIAKATVAAMWADFGTSNQADQSGRWSFGPGTGPHWMKVDAEGFETLIFDYVDKSDPQSNGADKPAFITPVKSAACPTPIYVRLSPSNSVGGFVTLDPAKGTRKKRTLNSGCPIALAYRLLCFESLFRVNYPLLGRYSLVTDGWATIQPECGFRLRLLV